MSSPLTGWSWNSGEGGMLTPIYPSVFPGDTQKFQRHAKVPRTEESKEVLEERRHPMGSLGGTGREVAVSP